VITAKLSKSSITAIFPVDASFFFSLFSLYGVLEMSSLLNFMSKAAGLPIGPVESKCSLLYICRTWHVYVIVVIMQYESTCSSCSRSSHIRSHLRDFFYDRAAARLLSPSLLRRHHIQLLRFGAATRGVSHDCSLRFLVASWTTETYYRTTGTTVPTSLVEGLNCCLSGVRYR
jgi:hypothetical protein